MSVLGTGTEVTAHSINALATWMIEHPVEAEDDMSVLTANSTPASEPPTPQTPEVSRPQLHRERSDPEIADCSERRPVSDSDMELVDWEETERELERRDRICHRRYGPRRHLAADIRSFFSIRPS